MSDIMSILQNNYLTVGGTTYSKSKYVNVDPTAYTGTWKGTYGSSSKPFTVTVSNVQGYKATVKYQSGSTVNYQQVLIKDASFRVGDSKFFLMSPGQAMMKTVITDPYSGQTYLQTGYATQQ